MGKRTVSVESVAIQLSDAGKRIIVSGMREPVADPQTIRLDAEWLFVTGAGWAKKQTDG